jgi:maltose/moltooligosaccharide transporter
MTATVAVVPEADLEDERRPLMTNSNIISMNLGFFGVQFSFGLTQSAVNPIFLLLGAEAHSCGPRVERTVPSLT